MAKQKNAAKKYARTQAHNCLHVCICCSFYFHCFSLAMNFISIVANFFLLSGKGEVALNCRGFNFSIASFHFFFLLIYLYNFIFYVYFFFQNYYLHSMYSLKISLNPFALVKYICMWLLLFFFLQNGDFF